MCSLLYRADDYIYNLVKEINIKTEGIIQITNPSMLIVMKKLMEEGKVKSYDRLNEKGVNRKYYSLTEKGKQYYSENYMFYTDSLNALKILIEWGEKGNER